MYKFLAKSIVIFLSISISNANIVLAQESDPTFRRVQRDFLDKIKPTLKQNCGDCHWGNDAEAELDFERYVTLDQLLQASSKWKKVVQRVTDGDMPPEDAEPLPAADRQQLLSWLDQLFNSIDCTNINPGRVTIRRLNRIEYQNTIRDLIGISYQPADSFPGDDVGYGFDNIADVLSLPPILMEKYLEAAEQITGQAIRDPAYPGLKQSIAGTAFQRGRSSSLGNGSHAMFTTDVIKKKLEFPETGEYLIRVRAFGDQAGDEPARLAFVIDGKEKTTKDVPATMDEPGEYDVRVDVAKGNHTIGLAFVNDYYNRDAKADRNLYVNRVWIEGPLNLTKIHEQIFFVQHGQEEQTQIEAAKKILRRFAGRAFRRPVTKPELQRLLSMYQQSRDENDSFEGAIGFALQAILVSPHFLFKIEQPTQEDRTRDLNPYELATSLSYFLWSTMPDAELFDLARSDKLLVPEVYRQQIIRMLADPRSKSLVENFAAQWLQLRALNDFQPDPEMFPGIDGDMRDDMAQETKLLFADLLKRDASIFELLDSNYTFLNERLAKHYQIDSVTGIQFRKVKLDGQRRGGLLTQASILTLTSNPTRTSPVKRGKWILENLLGAEPSNPAPDVMALEDQSELTGTLRERMEQHRKNPECATCHLTMDALGFSLENYDAVGRWRDLDEDLPIDASGELPDGTVFTGANGLQKLVGNEMRDQFLRCFSEKLLIYALGRGLEYYDECSVDKILERAATSDYRISEFVLAICESEPFRQRRGQLLTERESPDE